MNTISQTAVKPNPAMQQQQQQQLKVNPAMQQQMKVNPVMQQQQKVNPSVQPVTTEYSIRVPKDNKKKHHIMRFNRNLKIDFKEWKGKTVKMERENNMKNFRELEEDTPKFGAGSEFGREAREEARRKKFGIASRQYKSEDQPWILKVDGKKEKKFKGIREGGVSENAAYYIFTHGSNGIIEAFPLKEWYNFQPVQRYKALSAEEAEEEFSKRNKSINYFNIMMKKRLRNEEEDADDADLEGEKKGKKSKKGKKNKDFKISEMDDWIDDDDDDDDNSNSEKEGSDDDGKDKKKKKKGALKKKKKRASDSEAFEESDDGDEEGRECDYISDSSASDSDLEQQKEMKSVAEEDALRKLLASGDEDEDEEEKKDEEDKNEEDEEEGKDKDERDKDKTAKGKDKAKDKKKKDGSDSSSDGEPGAAQSKDDKKLATKTQSSRSGTPTAAASASTSETLKRPASSTSEASPVKKMKLENSYVYPNTSNSGESRTITEDAVRRYLMRKPMTATELCQKFKKKSGLSSVELVETMTKILRNINPTSQKIKEKTYFSIKVDPKQQHLQNS